MSNPQPNTGFHTNPERINRNGRPKGLCLTTMIKQALEENDDLTGKQWKWILVDKILSKAINNGDTTMLCKIWAYIDGMPKQGKEMKNGEPNTLYDLFSRLNKESKEEEMVD